MVNSRAEYQRQYRLRRKRLGIKANTQASMERSKLWLASTYRTLRLELLAIVGDRCVGCGLTDIRVLEFDHIANDGSTDRSRFKGARPMLMYYVGHPEEARSKLQMLCRNCNWLKRKGYDLPKCLER